MKLVLILGGTVSAIGIFLLATASGDTIFLAQQYPAACISDINRPMIARFVSFLRTCGISDRVPRIFV